MFIVTIYFHLFSGICYFPGVFLIRLKYLRWKGTISQFSGVFGSQSKLLADILHGSKTMNVLVKVYHKRFCTTDVSHGKFARFNGYKKFVLVMKGMNGVMFLLSCNLLVVFATNCYDCLVVAGLKVQMFGLF